MAVGHLVMAMVVTSAPPIRGAVRGTVGPNHGIEQSRKARQLLHFRKPFGVARCCTAEALAQRRIVNQSLHRRRECNHISAGHKEPVLVVNDHLSLASGESAYYWTARAHSLVDDIAKWLGQH